MAERSKRDGSATVLARLLKITFQLRVREEINLHFQESSRPHGKARGGRIAGYLTDEQRSQAGWIGALKCEFIFERALRVRNMFNTIVDLILDCIFMILVLIMSVLGTVVFGL